MKTANGVTRSWVRIPPPPPVCRENEAVTPTLARCKAAIRGPSLAKMPRNEGRQKPTLSAPLQLASARGRRRGTRLERSSPALGRLPSRLTRSRRRPQQGMLVDSCRSPRVSSRTLDALRHQEAQSRLGSDWAIRGERHQIVVARAPPVTSHSLMSMACASRSRSMYGSPLTSTATRLMVPPVKRHGISPG